MKSVFTYEPEEYFDCGELGEHPISFLAWIWKDTCGDGSTRHRVDIVSANLQLKIGKGIIDLSILPAILDYPGTRLNWEEEILAAWKSAHEHDWEEGA